MLTRVHHQPTTHHHHHRRPSVDDASPPPPTAIDDDEHTPLVVDVITDSPASPSGAVDDDIKPVDLTSMRDQDAADDVRVMREAYDDENMSEDDDALSSAESEP